MDVQAVINLAVRLGFDKAFVEEIITKLGNDVLNTLVEGVQHGFDPSTLTNLLKLLGSDALSLLVQLYGKSKGDKVSFNLSDGQIMTAAQQQVFNGSVLQALFQLILSNLVQPTPGPAPSPVTVNPLITLINVFIQALLASMATPVSTPTPVPSVTGTVG